ncbi:DNA gyrase inhibitor YacG [Yoonia sp.]|uniref:DNA gyrase inhibitor YacG n=1 Tax=Yoonia sp. TaxID=2212373 RepID=UPI0019DF6B4D|nr:DNA gyrase inhibitor YacG [Yoonia sp.]MBE0414758.1 DNA gyrase inhibitor YacG [Yoonia sp.]
MACPICNKPTAAKFRPFCSKHCADIDLGKWLTGSYAIPAQDRDDLDALEEELRAAEEHKPH